MMMNTHGVDVAIDVTVRPDAAGVGLVESFVGQIIADLVRVEYSAIAHYQMFSVQRHIRVRTRKCVWEPVTSLSNLNAK
jgi:hypothetical protein